MSIASSEALALPLVFMLVRSLPRAEEPLDGVPELVERGVQASVQLEVRLQQVRGARQDDTLVDRAKDLLRTWDVAVLLDLQQERPQALVHLVETAELKVEQAHELGRPAVFVLATLLFHESR